MRKILLLCCLALLLPALKGLPIPLDQLEWKIPPGHGSQTRVGEVMELVLEKPEQSSGCWQTAVLRQPVRLDPHRFLQIDLRSIDGQNHLLHLTLRRRLQPGDEASFYSIIEVGPAWKRHELTLQSGHRARASAGYFVFTKGTPRCDIDLSHGGELVQIQVSGSAPARLQMRDVALSGETIRQDDWSAKLGRQVQEHPLHQPYQFAEILPGEGEAAGAFSVVVPERSSPSVRFAAEELARYLRQVTGAEHAILSMAPDGPWMTLEVQPGVSGFASEFLAGRQLRLWAGSERDLLYGVYDFLEKSAGIRWFAPFAHGEIVPRNPDLRLPRFRDHGAPLMSYRSPHYCSYTRAPGFGEHIWQMADWAVKNRYNVELERIRDRERLRDFYALRGGCIWLPENAGHNFHKLIPPADYFADHPEFFCYELSTGQWRAERAQLCTTNPELVAELGRLAAEYFARNPEDDCFPLFQEDGHRLWCQCPPCLALNPSGSNLASASDQNIHLANLVYTEIQKRNPGKGVFTYAYSISSRPPQRVKPLPGVRVMYCYYSDGQPDHRPWQHESMAHIREWSQLTGGNLVLYTYHSLSPRYAFNTEQTLVEMFRVFALMGIQGSHQETAENWGGVDGYLLYLGGRLAWNPWFDHDGLRQDYFSKLYGAGGEPMQQWYALLSATLSERRHWRRHGHNQYPSIPVAELARLDELLNAALAAVAGDARAAEAVHFQAMYQEYLAAWALAMESGDAYYREPGQERYLAASAAIDAFSRQLPEWTRYRVVSHYVSRIVPAWRGNLEASWQENKAVSELGREHEILQVLNPWLFRPDPQVVGESEQWHGRDVPVEGWTELKAGAFWEDQGVEAYDGVGWYRITLDIPDSPGKRFGLYFGGADERAWVYLNGELIGSHHEGDAGVLWNEPFQVWLPENLPAGRHQLAVRVLDTAGKGGLWRDVRLFRSR